MRTPHAFAKGLSIPLTIAICLQMLGSVLTAPLAHAAIDPNCPVVGTQTLAAPTNVHPAEGTSVTGTFNIFSWNAVTDADTYVLQIFSSDPSLPNPTSYLCETSTDTQVDANGIASVRVDGIPDGSYWWDVRGLNAGTDGAWSVMTHFTKTANGPQVSLATPTVHQLLDGTVPITGTISDAADFHYRLSSTNSTTNTGVYDSGLINETGGVTTDVSYDWDTAGLANGPYAVHLRAEDVNSKVASQVVHVIIDHNALAAPVVTAPNDGAYVKPTNLTVVWDAAANASVYNLDLSASSAKHADGSLAAPVAGYPVQVTGTQKTITGLADGTYYYELQTQDSHGKVSDWSTLRSVHVLSTFPATPSITTPANGSASHNRTPSIVASAYSASAPQASSQWQVATDPAFAHLVIDSGADTTDLTTLTVTQANALADGTYYARVAYTDVAGNVSAWSAADSFTVDAVAPTAPIVTDPAAALSTTATTHAVSGTAEAGSLVTLKQGATVVATQQLAAGATGFSFTVSLQLGANSFSLTATDAAANVSAATTAPTMTRTTVVTGTTTGTTTVTAVTNPTTRTAVTTAAVQPASTPAPAPVTAPAPTTTPTIAAVVPTPTPEATVSPTPTATPTENGDVKAASTSRNWTPWIILAILIALAILATAGYFYWFGGDDDNNGSTPPATGSGKGTADAAATDSKANDPPAKKADKDKRW